MGSCIQLLLGTIGSLSIDKREKSMGCCCFSVLHGVSLFLVLY